MDEIDIQDGQENRVAKFEFYIHVQFSPIPTPLLLFNSSYRFCHLTFQFNLAHIFMRLGKH